MTNIIGPAFEGFISRLDLSVIFEKALHSVVVVLLAMIVTKVIHVVIRRATRNNTRVGTRGITFAKLMNSVVTYAVWIIALLELARVIFNINPTSIFAAAGIAGVALGFGAQSLVKDVISGIFIMFENLMSVGDLISVGDTTGTVIEIGVRSTKLRDYTGDFFVIPNGDITKLVNHSRFDRCVVCDVQIDGGTPLESAISVLSEVCEAARTDIAALLQKPEILGVTNITDGRATLRVTCMTRPGEQFGVEREMLARIREGFRASDLPLPADRIVVITGPQTPLQAASIPPLT